MTVLELDSFAHDGPECTCTPVRCARCRRLVLWCCSDIDGHCATCEAEIAEELDRQDEPTAEERACFATCNLK